MRKLLFVIIAVLMLAPVAQAATTAAIAVVDVPKIIRECEGGKAIREQLKSTFQGPQSDLDRQKEMLEKLSAEMQKQSLVLSQDAKMDKEIEFKRKVRDYQDTLRNFQRKFKAEEQQLSQPLLDIIVKAIQAYGKKHKLGLILDVKAGVLYAADAADVTNELIVEVDKAWKAKK